MKKFFAYIACLIADLLIIGFIANSIVRTIIYAIVGVENHYVYMLVRVILLLVVFLIGCLIINNKISDKQAAFKNGKIKSIIDGETTHRKVILNSKVFINETISFNVLALLLLVIFLPSLNRLGGALIVTLSVIITLLLMTAYTFINYYLTHKTLQTVISKWHDTGASNESQNK